MSVRSQIYTIRNQDNNQSSLPSNQHESGASNMLETDDQHQLCVSSTECWIKRTLLHVLLVFYQQQGI